MAERNPVTTRGGKIVLVCPTCYKEHLRDGYLVFKLKKIFRCCNGCTTRLQVRRQFDSLPLEAA